jgi:hypothetical protein
MPESISSALATPSASTKDGSLIIDTRILVDHELRGVPDTDRQLLGAQRQRRFFEPVSLVRLLPIAASHAGKDESFS